MVTKYVEQYNVYKDHLEKPWWLKWLESIEKTQTAKAKRIIETKSYWL